MTVYVDVLIILNMYINYFLIRSTALLMRREISQKRSVLSASAGAIGSLVILLPPLPFIVIFLEKAIICGIITLIAFGKQEIKDFLVSSMFFLTVNFIFGGLMLTLYTIFTPYSMICENGVYSFNIPIQAVVLFTIAGYLLIRLIRLLSDRQTRVERICKVEIQSNNKSAIINALCDTGCEIHDIFSGSPIIICNASAIYDLLPNEIISYLKGQTDDCEKLRLVPYRTISSQSLIPVFKPNKLIINGKNVTGYIGVSLNTLGNDIECVFNPEILSI